MDARRQRGREAAAGTRGGSGGVSVVDVDHPRTANHEPEDVNEDGYELDGGYDETDPPPEMEFHGLSDAEPALVG